MSSNDIIVIKNKWESALKRMIVSSYIKSYKIITYTCRHNCAAFSYCTCIICKSSTYCSTFQLFCILGHLQCIYSFHYLASVT